MWARARRACTRTRVVVTSTRLRRPRARGTAAIVTPRTRLLSVVGATRWTSYPAATRDWHSFSKMRVSNGEWTELRWQTRTPAPGLRDSRAAGTGSATGILAT